MNKSNADDRMQASFSNKIRRTFTKVLAAGLAVFSVAPVVRSLMPRAEAIKYPEIASKENSKHNRKKSKVKKHDIDRKAAMLGFILADLLSFGVVAAVLIKLQSNSTPTQPQNLQNPVITVNVSFRTQEGDKLLYNNREQAELRLSANDVHQSITEVLSRCFDFGNSRLTSAKINGQIVYSTEIIRNGDNIEVVVSEHDRRVFSYRDQRIQDPREVQRQQEHVQNLESPAITVHVNFFTPHGVKLTCLNQEQVSLTLKANDDEQQIRSKIFDRFGVRSGDITTLSFQRNNGHFFPSLGERIQNGDNIKIVITNHRIYQNFSCEQDRLEEERKQEAIQLQEQQRLEKERLKEEQTQRRKQRDEETPVAKNERRMRQDESIRNQETQKYKEFETAKRELKNERANRTEQGIIEENPKRWNALQQNNPSLTESLLNEIAFKFFFIYNKNLKSAHLYAIEWFISFFEKTTNLNISNLEEFSSYYRDQIFLNLYSIIENHPHHKEIVLFFNSFGALARIGGLKTNNPTSDLKSNLVSLQRVNRDFGSIKEDEFLKNFSAPIVEAVDRIIKELETILLSRSEAEKEEEIPAENLPQQGELLGGKYAPLGRELGSGGNGTVCLYLDTEDRRKVAIKTNYRKDFSAEQFEKLKNIDSPYVARIIGRIPREIEGKSTADIVMDYVEGGVPLKHYVYNNNSEETILKLCKQLVEGAIALSNHGVCDLDFQHTNNILVNKDGNLKYIDYDDQIIKTSEEAEKSNFNRVKNMVFDILKFNFPTTLYKKLIEKMGYTLKVKEERNFPIFHRRTDGVLYNQKDVIEVPSDLVYTAF